MQTRLLIIFIVKDICEDFLPDGGWVYLLILDTSAFSVFALISAIRSGLRQFG